LQGIISTEQGAFVMGVNMLIKSLSIRIISNENEEFGTKRNDYLNF